MPSQLSPMARVTRDCKSGHQGPEPFPFLRWLDAAEQSYSELSMDFNIFSVRWCRGTMLGQAGRAQVEEAEAWMKHKGIVHPGRYANIHIRCTEP
jgi:hypothetical protein